MKQVQWTALAERDRQSILGYFTEGDQEAIDAKEFRLSKHIENLARHPELGRPGRIPGTRELVVDDSQLLIYEILGDAVLVLRMLSTRQQWPNPPNP